ncbi:UvrD-helicase domain-containing protein, partial [Pseudoalteromonas sp. SIMBA_153]
MRNRLPVILEERGETTFSLQMVRLNQALTGRQGDKLARYIRHHYPVALIDESQDINGEQAIMIESI